MRNTEVPLRSGLLERVLVCLVRSDETLIQVVSRSAFGVEAPACEVHGSVWNFIFIGGDRMIDLTRICPCHGFSGLDRHSPRLERKVVGHRDGLVRR